MDFFDRLIISGVLIGLYIMSVAQIIDNREAIKKLPQECATYEEVSDLFETYLPMAVE